MIKKNKLFLFLAVCAALCVPVHAEDNGLSMDEAMSIILSHHGVVTDMDVTDYLTLDAEAMTREAAVTAVVRSFGVYPAGEPDYVWADEAEQAEIYRDESDHEFFADSFAMYMLWPDELAANAPTVYRHMEMCLREMKSESKVNE